MGRIYLRGRSLLWAVVIFLILMGQLVPVQPYSLERGEDDSESSLSQFTMLLMSLGFLLCGVLVLALCTGGFRNCWPTRYFYSRRSDVPTFANPIAANSSGRIISEIDVRALELDPIVFEPLPTLTDLTPRHVDDFPVNMSMGRAGAIVPFTSDESSVYAHDWFDEPFRNFPRGNLEYFKVLGKSWFGQIIEAEARDIVPYARKIRVLVKVLREDASGLEQMRFLDESRLYRDADNGNVLKLLGHSIEMTPFLLIMEYCPQGDLKSYLISNVTRADLLNSRGDIVRMALDIAKGLEWMGSADFTHGDLAARNCQVGSEGRIVIGDYGNATQIFKDDYYWSANIAIPLRWAAPETVHCTINTIQTLKVTKLSNVWTFGVVLWEICEFGKLPYFELNDDEVISRVLSDRTYILSQPTMPCLLLREELFKIMAACWNPEPDKRPSISTIVEVLTSLLSNAQFAAKKKDDFDSKWEQLGNGQTGGGPNYNSVIKQPTTPNEVGKRKSVSFQDAEPSQEPVTAFKLNVESRQQVEANELQTQAHFLQSTGGDISLSPSSSFSRTQINFENNNGHDPFPSLDLWKPADPDEELWRTRIERGDISKKVREKSQSVQDLMILTHVEPGDLSDPDSLVMVSNGKNWAASPPNSDSPSLTPLRKASSDTAINSASSSPIKASSQISTIPAKTSSLFVPEIQVIPATPTNITGINIKVTQATPSPGISINVIQPTPSPATDPSPISPENPGNPTGNGITPHRSFRFVFKDDDDEDGKVTRKPRHTSTPIRSPSPSVLNMQLDGSSNSDSCAFEANESSFSPQISPISVEQPSDFKTVDTVDTRSSVVLGASEELGLNPYQSITSELGDPSLFKNYDVVDQMQPRDCVKKSKIPKTHFALGPQTKSDSSGPTSSASDSNKENAGGVDMEGYSTYSILSLTDHETSDSADQGNSRPGFRRKLLFEDDDHLPGDVECTTDVPLSSQSISGSGISSTSPSGSGNETSRVAGTPPSTESEEDEFWSKQMQSLQQATGNTLALFQLGLDSDVTHSETRGKKFPSAKETFEEDIKATTEELGSLVLFDLDDTTEGTKSQAVIVKETRELLTQNGSPLPPGQAFGGEVKDEPSQIVEPEEDEESKVVPWAVNSVEIRKNSGSLNSNSLTTDEEVDDETEQCTDFVPSKWNSALNPSKPAIKSPEVQPEMPASSETQKKTGIRKSVSFERKRTQLVYEYPPPNPLSDSEEEDSKRYPVASAGPLSLSLDWELQPDELEEAQIHHEDWEDDVLSLPKTENKKPSVDMYRISGFDENFQVRPSRSGAPFEFSAASFSGASASTSGTSSSSMSRLGELRHTRDRLKLDLCNKGEASMLDEDGKSSGKLDSGVGSSANVSPFSQL